MKKTSKNKVNKASKMTPAEGAVWSDFLAGILSMPEGHVLAAQVQRLPLAEKRKILASIASTTDVELAEMKRISSLPLPEMERAIRANPALSEGLESALDLTLPPAYRSN